MPTKSKGKARSVSPIAEPTERSPLLTRSTADAESIRSLASSSSSALYTVDTPATGHAHRRTRRFAILISIYSLFLGVAVFVVLFAVSFIPSQIEQDRLHEAFIYHDPKVDILNVAEDGVHISLTLRGGVDVDRALATDGRRGSGWWESLRQSAVHGLLGVLPTQAVYVTLPEVLVCARGGGLPLLNVSLPSDVVVPLTKKSELVEIEIEAVGNPVAPAGELWTWGQDTWANGTIDVVIGIREAQATIPGAWWSKWAVVTQKDLIVPLAMPVPPVPNLPPPGTPLDLSKLVTLDNYQFSADPDLKIMASASLPNPALKQVPFALPFGIQIGPDHEAIAQVVARAAKVTTETIGIMIEGDILAVESGDALSTFLQHYLNGEGNPIRVRGLSAMPKGYNGPDAPPPWVLRSLPSLELDLVFPAPPDQPDIIREVTIEKIRLGQADGRMMASGTVVANIELPPGMERVALNVSAIRPDVMIHDGPVQGDTDEYDPDHPPPKAFGRIAPDYFLNSTTAPSQDPATPHRLVVRAPFENLLLDVLPGRDGVLSDFVTKILLKGGATAGIGGLVDVKADLGIGILDIAGLPVHGEFWAGRSFGVMLRQNGK